MKQKIRDLNYYRNYLQYIADIALGRDGYTSAKDLGELVDELRSIAIDALKGERECPGPDYPTKEELDAGLFDKDVYEKRTEEIVKNMKKESDEFCDMLEQNKKAKDQLNFPIQSQESSLDKVLEQVAKEQKTFVVGEDPIEVEFTNAMFSAIGTIMEKQKKDKKSSGYIECPLCEKRLNYAIAPNGHIHGQCETIDCLNWMM